MHSDIRPHYGFLERKVLEKRRDALYMWTRKPMQATGPLPSESCFYQECAMIERILELEDQVIRSKGQVSGQ